ncbi:phosphoglycerate kinase [Blastomonas sp. CCH8-A3]|uniref:phosphoglycerate kinase n=1 Tax=Blastomonas sp. CCH8-A3 TaxID=1768743 RepID=UPI000825EB9E|nr:phosphoglycerate kinase [Blastomonas sp. CCH8-A3]
MFKTLDDLIADRHGLAGKPVLVREDLNVPIHEGRVSDDTRLRAAMPTLAELADHGAKVLVLAHFGRPKGKVDPAFTLRPIAHALSEVMGRPVGFLESPDRHAIDVLDPGSITVLENSRFFPGEEKNDPVLAKQIASLGDFYVNDAFSAAHRAHVTTEGLAHVLPAFAGRQMEAELKALEAALGKPEHPVAAVVGGSKVSTKLDVLTNLVGKVDHLIIGGGMANTFLAARGVDVGKSLCEHLPYDVVVAKEFGANVPCRTANVHEVEADEMILDVGAAAVEALSDVLKTCRTLVWNGPLGAFEYPPFDTATVALARTAAALTREGTLVSVAGGGDTVAALNHAGAADDFSFVSTAGGAFLEWMEGKELPGVKALES